MTLTAMLLAIASLTTAQATPSTPIDTGAPVTRACAAPARTGTFRVVATRANSTFSRPAMLVLENINGCLEITFVTDNVAPVIIDQLRVSADSVTGSIKLDTGAAIVALQFDGSNVSGSIHQGRQQWLLEGRRTS
jgi:hypothetical protein